MTSDPPALRPFSARRSWLLGAVVVAWTLVAFLPTVPNGFVNWDDPRMFLENPYHRGPVAREFRYAWTSHLLGEYMPVTWMSYTLDRWLFDLHAPGYHLTSVILHALAALAVYALARRLLRIALDPDARRPGAIDVGAAAAALIFALHPLRVEPVAWVSARGTVLGGLLLVLSTLVCVTGWERGRRTGGVAAPWLGVALILFVLSILARATGLVLPAVLTVLDVYPLRRIDVRPAEWGRPVARRAWGEKALFGAVGLLALPMGFLARGEEVGDFHRAGWDPLVGLGWAVYSVGFYVWKTVVVGALSPIYRMPSREHPMLVEVLASAVVVVAITGILVTMRRRWPGALAAWIAYLLLVAPMSGIVPFGRLRGAVDRYTYVACIGWAVVAGGVVASRWRGSGDGRDGVFRGALAGAALVALLLVWTVVAWRQAPIWRNGVALWTRAVVVVPDSPVARSNLGTALIAVNDVSGAVAQYREVARLWPREPGALRNLGRALVADGKPSEAVEPLRRLVELRPGSVEGYLDLGATLYNLGDADQALGLFTRAVELGPDSVRAHASLAAALSRVGRAAEAREHLRRANALDAERSQGLNLAVPRPGADVPGGS